MIPIPEKILIIRNDKLGDFCLSLPTFALLKHCLPSVELHALVPGYTQPIAEACPHIDKVIIDPGSQADKHAMSELKSTLQAENYPVALTLFSTTRIGLLLSRAKIPTRIAPATKIAQIFYNHRIRQRRSQSLKPEYEYNLDLAKALLRLVQINCDFSPLSPYLIYPELEIAQLRDAFVEQYNITDKRLIFIHPGSGGSANNLDLNQFSDLALALSNNDQYYIVISAGPGEYDIAHEVAAKLNRAKLNQAQVQHCVYESRDGLTQFAKHIAFADLFVSGSTGPLHIAGALNRPTVGFYPNRQSATPLRWQTLSQDDHRLAFSPPGNANKEDMSSVNLENAITEIKKLLTRL